jgi:glycerophosphoryl diester phosphodiesterase
MKWLLTARLGERSGSRNKKARALRLRGAIDICSNKAKLGGAASHETGCKVSLSTPKQAAAQALPWGLIDRRPLVIAHRGGANLWAENSLFGFRQAVRSGFRDFEIDVHGTRDGELVVIHDATIDRTTNGHGQVRDLNLHQLRAFQLTGTDETVPLLRDVLAFFRDHGARAIVEVKFSTSLPDHDDLCRALVDEVVGAGMLPYVTVSAFSWESLQRLQNFCPSLGLTAVLSARELRERGGIHSVAAQAVELGAADLGLEWTAATRNAAEVLHRSGMRLGVWTPNETEEIVELASRGVDWVITDSPDVALDALETLQ